MHRRPLAIIAVLVAATGSLSSPLAAQSLAPTAPASAADLIVADSLARHVEVIAHDSMMGRETPSPELDKTARYVADELQKLGLTTAAEPVIRRRCRPNGQCSLATDEETNPLVQRYPLIGGLVPSYANTRLNFALPVKRGATQVLTEEGWPVEKRASVTFDDAARFAVDTLPESGGRGTWEEIAPPQVFVVAGPHTLQSLRQAALRDKIVLYLPPPGIDTVLLGRLVNRLYTANRVVVVSDEDSASFAARREASQARPVVVVNRYMEGPLDMRRWVAYVRADAIEPFLATAGLDPGEVRRSEEPAVVRLPAARVSLTLHTIAMEHEITVPNVLGILEGSDSVYRQQYVVFTAHMDGRGLRRGTAGDVDSGAIDNGAVDNASGVAGLIELARAYAQSGERPRRSLVFLAVSGGAKDFSGAYRFVDKARRGGWSIVANVNLDMIGRPAGDSVMVDGIHDLDLEVRPDWIAAEHPELALTVVDGGVISTPESDHIAFVRSAVPSLYFHNGTHERAARATDAPDIVDTEHEARVLRLIYYVGREIANAERKPSWTSSGRRHRLMILGQ